VDHSFGKKYQGLGLGLSLTKRLVELHKGKILAESNGLGQGANFRFIPPWLFEGEVGLKKEDDMFKKMRNQRLTMGKEDHRNRCAHIGWSTARIVLVALAMLSLAGNGWTLSNVEDLTQLSLEDLMRIEVTSVSKKGERLSDAPAAIFVITQEDIRRSGVTSIPEALRMAPGVEVAKIDANKWAISARGFNSRFATKLLVLLDGRSIYSPVFSGVWWDVQDTLLEDIDRIEVIRGPGATLWGANAVNGVINIITRKAGETQGGLISAGAGTEEKGFGAVRYGLKTGENTAVRAYAKYFNRDASVTSTGAEAADEWDQFRTGFRMDHEPSGQNNFTLQGDYYQGRSGSTYNVVTLSPPYSMSFDEKPDLLGGNVLGRWKHVYSNTSELTLQAYYDRTDRRDTFAAEERDTGDIDLQHRFKWIGGQEIIWGLGYRLTRDDIKDNNLRTISPTSQSNELFSAFIQDDITLIDDRLRWVIGSKFEHNDYTGFEVQPSTRLIWTPSKDQSLWGAISRSVRTPSRAERTVTTNVAVIPPGQAENPGPLPIQIQILGNTNFASEELIAYELGYRLRPTHYLNIDLAGYYNRYSKLRSNSDPADNAPTLAFSSGQPYINQTLELENGLSKDIYGVELALEWQPLSWWRIKGTYTFMKSDTDESSRGLKGAQNLDFPQHQFSVRSMINVGKDIEADTWLRYVDSFDNGSVPRYYTLDVRLAWRPVKNLELALVGQNLLENRHQEFRPEQFSTQIYEARRGVYGKMTLKF
jgi:iron complex outermembrane recepter protein